MAVGTIGRGWQMIGALAIGLRPVMASGTGPGNAGMVEPHRHPCVRRVAVAAILPRIEMGRTLAGSSHAVVTRRATAADR